MTNYTVSEDDYPHKVPEKWDAVEIDEYHLIYENPEDEYAIELMQYEDEWWLSTSKPNPMRGGMMDLVDHWEYQLDEIDEAYDKINEIMSENEV